MSLNSWQFHYETGLRMYCLGIFLSCCWLQTWNPFEQRESENHISSLKEDSTHSPNQHVGTTTQCMSKHLHFQHTEDFEWNILRLYVQFIPFQWLRNTFSWEKQHFKVPQWYPEWQLCDTRISFGGYLGLSPEIAGCNRGKGWFKLGPSLLKICEQILVVTTITGMRDKPKDTQKIEYHSSRKYLQPTTTPGES